MSNSFSKYDVYTTTASMYCYVNTNVLRNKFGIHSNEVLHEVEADITTIRQHDLLENPISGRFSATHLCNIHRYLFGDIYAFAGHYRRESISKGSTIFENPNDIAPKLKKLLNTLKTEQYLKDLDENHFIARLAYYFAELNYLHPFREGNGRSTREFIRQLLLANGYMVDWSAVTVDVLLDAMADSVYNTNSLIQVLSICVHKIPQDM